MKTAAELNLETHSTSNSINKHYENLYDIDKAFLKSQIDKLILKSSAQGNFSVLLDSGAIQFPSYYFPFLQRDYNALGYFIEQTTQSGDRAYYKIWWDDDVIGKEKKS